MITALLILTIINSLALGYLFFIVNNSIYMTLKKDFSDKKILLGWTFTIWKRTHYGATGIFIQQFSIKNRAKVRIAEEVERLIKDTTNQRYNLNAMFSWCKTWDAVNEFKKNYRVVNPTQVDALVAKFVPKEI